MLDIYQTLEFNAIRLKIASFTQSEKGKSRILNLKMYEETILKEVLEFLDELVILNLRYGNLPILNSKDLEQMMAFALKGGTLDVLELEAIAYDVLISLKLIKSLEKRGQEFPLIQKKIKEISLLDKIEQQIHHVIAPDLTIFDHASKTLANIRKQLKEKEAKLHSQMQKAMVNLSEYLGEALITIRDGHFVLPIKTIHKNKVRGIIHDLSDSGATTFIEPDWAVELNNELYLLKKEESEEIKRLLNKLTSLVCEHSFDILKNNEIIALFDYTQAKALYALKNEAIVASLQKDKIIDLKKARHPLIDPLKVVGNDFYFDQENYIIVISGPNAGGKTVALKTLALMVLMNQCGLALPTSQQARLSYFNNIYADIGDQQSLFSNLSTFSSHIKNLSYIAENVTSKDLVILDEIGTGTSPLEGEAIAISYLNYLKEKKVFTFSSSHYDGLKNYALNEAGVINASVLFDEEKMMPTYVLKMNVPGRSYGLEVAMKFNLQEDIVLKAKDYLTKSGLEDSNQALTNLQKLINENETINKDLKKKTSELQLKEEKLATLEEKIKNEQQQLFLESEEIKKELIKKAKEDIDLIFQKSQDENLKLHEVIKVKKELDNLVKTPLKEEEIYDENINEGDYVLIANLNIEGRVKQKRTNKLVIVTAEGLTFQTSLEGVKKISPPKKKKEVEVISTPQIMDVKLELNIIGLYVDEAMPIVMKYLDNARLKRFKQVRIIHGFGKGALRKALHEYLKQCSFVESYRLGGEHEGGGGATIIIFK